MSDLFGNHIVGFPTRRLTYLGLGAIFILNYRSYVFDALDVDSNSRHSDIFICFDFDFFFVILGSNTIPFRQFTVLFFSKFVGNYCYGLIVIVRHLVDTYYKIQYFQKFNMQSSHFDIVTLKNSENFNRFVQNEYFFLLLKKHPLID